MGWNWISNLAKSCNLYVITEGEWRQEIESEVSIHPYKDHLHFFYLPVTPDVRKMCWNQGDWRFYYYYRRWQKRAYNKAKEILDEYDIDVIHHLNMVTFREPGVLWKLDKPFVWGPIGGLTSLPTAYLKDAPWKLKLKLILKNYLTICQLKFNRRINKALRQSDAIIAAVPSAQEKILHLKGIDTILINETGCYEDDKSIIDHRHRNEFHILWVGRFIFTKRLDIALNTIAKLKIIKNVKFHIVGSGTEEQVTLYRKMAHKLDIDDICEWHGNVEHGEVMEMMRQSDILFFTSVLEATSTVVPEAINCGLPIVCFNTCGFGPIVTGEIGEKVDLTIPEESVDRFAEVLLKLYNDKESLHLMSVHCKETIKHLLWEKKAEQMVGIYQGLLKNEGCR